MIKGILFLTLLLNHIVFAGTIVNSPSNQSSSAKTYGIGTSKIQIGNIYNKTGVMNNATIDMSNNSKAYFGTNNSKTGKIYIKDGYIDTKKCYKELGVPYDERKVKITLIDNETIKINNKEIKVSKCLVKENNK